MSEFARQPFETQRALIRRAFDDDRVAEVLDASAALPDAEPLIVVVQQLQARELLPTYADRLREHLAALPDASLQAVFDSEITRETRADLADHALRAWPLERANALAFLSRWLRRNAPDRFAALSEDARAALDGGDHDPRWLLYVDGTALLAAAERPAWRERVATTVDTVIRALAHAPKSISQANAESLLARRVYADRGHFFFELLQNADDAGARSWSVSIDPERITIRHDGAPFSFLDIVGVLSIGQTTKSADQIGFFGVGFKSVYEVCDRPRIRSGVFDVEIAQVSIPRALGDADEVTTDTVLTLPLREGEDASALERYARRIPPETLLTLPNLSELRVSGPTSRQDWSLRSGDGVRNLLGAREGLDPEHRVYRTLEHTARYDGDRELGRVRESPVMVAVALDAGGAPRTLDGPTLFAFLPMAMHTGLRVLVHARFDVTVDRERLEHESTWNTTLLEEAGRTLAALAGRVAEDGHSPLGVLPLRAELAPDVLPLAVSLANAVADRACLPSANGVIAPRDAFVLPLRLQGALEGEELGDKRALAHVGARERAVALELGATAFELGHLLAFSRDRLQTGAPPPAWLNRATLEMLAGAGAESLRALPICVAGRVLATPGAAQRGTGAMATLYDGLRAVVSTGWLSEHRELADALGLDEFDLATLVSDLLDPVSRGPLLERDAALVEVLLDAPRDVLEALVEVPILRNLDGRRAAARDLRAAPAWMSPALRDALGALGAPVDALIAAGAEGLQERWLAPMTFADLTDTLADADLGDAPQEALDILAAALDAHADRIDRASALRLAERPLFADIHGVRRPLIGAERAWSAASPDLVAALPDAPWASQSAFRRAVAPPPVGPDAIVTLLVDASEASDAHVEAWSDSALQVLARHRGELGRDALERLEGARIWRGADGDLYHSRSLRRGTPAGGTLDEVYADGARRLARADALRAYDALGLADSPRPELPRDDRAAFIDDLATGRRRPLDAACRAALFACVDLPRAALAPLRAVAFIRDEDGEPRVVAPTAGALDNDGARRGGRFRDALRSRFSLISEDDERDLGPLLDALGVPAPTLAEVLEVASSLSREALFAALAADPDALTARDRETVAELPVFLARDGELKPASELAVGDAFDRALDDEVLASLRRVLIDPEDAARCRAFGIATRRPIEVFDDELAPRERETLRDSAGDPLDLVRSRARLHSLARLAGSLDADPSAHALALDVDGEVVRPPLLDATDAARTLAMSTRLRARLADAEWAKDADASFVAELSDDALAAALRDTFSGDGSDSWDPARQAALVAWLRAAREQLSSEATDALRQAAVFPSADGRRVRASSLVLDPNAPDLGIPWGLASSFPDDVAAWLARTFEPDRHTRRVLIERVLDAFDRAAENDDRGRARELLTFLAGALGAATESDAEVDERARRLDVRKRLRVPTTAGDWRKPRQDTWVASGARLDEFVRELPPEVDLGSLADPATRLLRLLGAQTTLRDSQVETLLDDAHRGSTRGGVYRASSSPDALKLLDGPVARRALARYVLERVLEEPPCVDRWGLRTRAFIPDATDALRTPSELVWPSALREILPPDSRPHPTVTGPLEASLSSESIASLCGRLGLREPHALSPSAFAPEEGGVLSAALLDFAEGQLTDERWTPSEVRAAFAEARLPDEQGIARRPSELAREGTDALFGDWRGDFGTHRRLANALGIPPRPSAAMIHAFLDDIGALLVSDRDLDPSALSELETLLPACLGALDGDAAPSSSAAVAALGTNVEIVLLSDPRLFLGSPPELAAHVVDAIVDILPSQRRTDALHAALLRAGVRDLWSVFDVARVDPGPRASGDATWLHDAIRPLGDRVGSEVRLVTHILAGGRLLGQDAELHVDAAVHDGVLYLTPAALGDPTLLAPTLAPEPSERESMARWLAERDGPPPSKVPAERRERATPAKSRGHVARRRQDTGSLWERLKARFAPEDSPSAGDSRHAFEEQTSIQPQLREIHTFSEDRLVAPEYGFAFAPQRLQEPYLYAPKLVATVFRKGAQTWSTAPLERPTAHGDAGTVRMRGVLPRGRTVLPVPHYGRVTQLRADGAEPTTDVGDHGELFVDLRARADVHVDIRLGELPNLVDARPSRAIEHRQPTVPDEELPDEVHDFISDLLADEAPSWRVIDEVRDFIRRRYRYDPSYLEDPAVGRWLQRVTRGRKSQAMATLHAGADGRHLGAGVCFELGHLACEMMRRAGVPAGVASGWVLEGGQISVPDHLWAVALLVDVHGMPIWVPVDAASTEEGRPLRVPQRAKGEFRRPKAPPPAPTRPRSAGWAPKSKAQRKRPRKRRKSSRVPKNEWFQVVRWLEASQGQPLPPEERRELLGILDDKDRRARLLAWLRDGS